MLKKSPSGALSPYYYKGGYFHGIHYGSYFDDSLSLYSMIEQEEAFILSSPESKRILMDFYETNLSTEVLEKIVHHIKMLKPKIIKLAVATDKKSLNMIRKQLNKTGVLDPARLYFGSDMEECKTWLVNDRF